MFSMAAEQRTQARPMPLFLVHIRGSGHTTPAPKEQKNRPATVAFVSQETKPTGLAGSALELKRRD